mmetsp:Transcript_41851/g.77478  ORF Transcript_41851/g.77478 Transcript_41851/m.77478 type:complete len:252 (-) Transcript_41851:145-900(-)
MNDDIDTTAGSEAEGHRHPMVIVRFNQDIVVDLIVLRGVNHAVVPVFLHRGSQLGALGHDGLHALRLLQPPRVHVPNRGGSVREERRNREGHGGVGNLAAVDVDSLQLRVRIARHGDALGVPRHLRAHLLHHVGEGHVALDALRAASAHRHGPAGDGRAGDEVTRRAGVALHENRFGADVFFRGGNVERWRAVHVALDLDIDSEFLHQSDRKGNVRGRNELVLNGNRDVSVRNRCCHKEGRKELRRHFPAD